LLASVVVASGRAAALSILLGATGCLRHIHRSVEPIDGCRTPAHR
jgi:hypothetical protein